MCASKFIILITDAPPRRCVENQSGRRTRIEAICICSPPQNGVESVPHECPEALGEHFLSEEFLAQLAVEGSARVLGHVSLNGILPPICIQCLFLRMTGLAQSAGGASLSTEQAVVDSCGRATGVPDTQRPDLQAVCNKYSAISNVGDKPWRSLLQPHL